jgi:hypothetical protein
MLNEVRARGDDTLDSELILFIVRMLCNDSGQSVSCDVAFAFKPTDERAAADTAQAVSWGRRGVSGNHTAFYPLG